MNNFLTKKQKLQEEEGVSKNPKLKIHQYNDDYLSFGFISNNVILPPLICIVYHEIVADEADSQIFMSQALSFV